MITMQRQLKAFGALVPPIVINSPDSSLKDINKYIDL